MGPVVGCGFAAGACRHGNPARRQGCRRVPGCQWIFDAFSVRIDVFILYVYILFSQIHICFFITYFYFNRIRDYSLIFDAFSVRTHKYLLYAYTYFLVFYYYIIFILI